MAISSLLRRLGYARLDDYGLILTPDDRVLSTRPAVLDDGLGGKIVGWREGDLAAMELERWEPAQPATRRAVADPKAIPPRPPVAAKVISPVAPPAPPSAPAPVKLPGVAPVAVAAPAPVVVVPPPAMVSQPAAVVAKPTVVAPPVAPVVADGPIADEDEWEWEIAMARARAAAEWAEEAAQAAVKPASPVVKPPVKPVVKPVVIAAPDPIKTDSWPKTEELHESWETPPPNKVERVARIEAVRRSSSGAAVDRPAVRPAAPVVAPRTIIPVPALPVASDPRMVRPSVPALPRVAALSASSSPTNAPALLRTKPPARFPKATSQIEDTIRTQAVAPANEDRTKPGIALPPSQDRTKPGIALPPSSAGKRVAFKQR